MRAMKESAIAQAGGGRAALIGFVVRLEWSGMSIEWDGRKRWCLCQDRASHGFEQKRARMMDGISVL